MTKISNSMKKTKAIYLIIVALVIGLTGCKDEVADRNAANIKLITEGMHWREAYRIMGEWQNCDTVNYRGLEEYLFIYKSHALASDDFRIFVSAQDSLITTVYRGD